MGVLAAVAVLLLGFVAPLKVTVSGPGHSPKVNTKWNYSVRITQGGKPVKAKITEQIVDPIGGRHPVQFGTSTKNITNWPVDGTFKDFIIWPSSSRGIPLKLHVIVVAGKARKAVDYSVTPAG